MGVPVPVAQCRRRKKAQGDPWCRPRPEGEPLQRPSKHQRPFGL